MGTIKPNFYEQQAHEKAVKEATANREAFVESLRQSGLPYETAMERLRQYDEANSVPDVPVSATTDANQNQTDSTISTAPEPQKPQGYGDYSWYGDWVNTHFNPLTNEERARRERAAYISSGVANLGKAFGALGNMFVAQHGAPAQKPVEVADADKRVNAFREYADKERNAYLAARTQRQKLVDDAYDKDWTRWKSAVDLNYRYAKAQEELALRRMEYDRRRAKDVLLAQAQEADIEGKKELANLRRTQAERYQALTEPEVKRILSQANLNNTRAAYIGATEETEYEYVTNPDGTLKLGLDGKPMIKGKRKEKQPVGGGVTDKREKIEY